MEPENTPPRRWVKAREIPIWIFIVAATALIYWPASLRSEVDVLALNEERIVLRLQIYQPSRHSWGNPIAEGFDKLGKVLRARTPTLVPRPEQAEVRIVFTTPIRAKAPQHAATLLFPVRSLLTLGERSLPEILNEAQAVELPSKAGRDAAGKLCARRDFKGAAPHFCALAARAVG